jgi:hypothetical protein
VTVTASSVAVTSASLVADASIRPAAAATVSIATSMLAEIAGELVLFGALLIIASWLAGPARAAVAFRRAVAPYLRDYPGPACAVLIVVIARRDGRGAEP